MNSSLNEISKFLSYVLRHKPDIISLEIDPEGWADIDDLIEKSNMPLSRELIHAVVESSDKQRFALSNDGNFIRANQGHSIQVDLGLTPTEPPNQLYHGTTTRFLDSIKKNGIQPQGRQYVHLSSDIETAQKVAQRHGHPEVLIINSLTMSQQGYEFFQAKNGVWLTKVVPIQFLHNP